MYNPFSIFNRTILITGASSGIGRSCAIECSKLGAKVIITGRDDNKLSEVYSSLQGDGHLKIKADLTISSDIDFLVDQLPKIDGCVNNAGIEDPKPVQFLNLVDIQKIFSINFSAPVLLTKMIVNRKLINKNASIVFTSSISGLRCSSVGGALYSASKSAINGFVKGAALDLANKGIRVNSVCPGMVNTGILDGIVSQDSLNDMIKQYPLRRIGRPEDIAFAIIYLLSDASQWMTGSNLVIDGGFTLN